MEAIAHSPSFAAKAKVPQSVGQDFARADDKAGITKTAPQTAHMARRRAAGLTHAEVGREFGVSKSTAHRKVSGAAIGRGFTRLGKA